MMSTVFGVRVKEFMPGSVEFNDPVWVDRQNESNDSPRGLCPHKKSRPQFTRNPYKPQCPFHFPFESPLSLCPEP